MQLMLGENTFQLYADHTVIYCSDRSVDLAESKLQNLMNKFSKWCMENALTINSKKSKIMVFGTRNKINKIDKIEISLNNE